jgi:ATP-dependent DNA helicase RecG
MNRDDLIERLKGYEWNDIEFKEAQTDVPRSVYETVSAFANTAGGWLVFGVRHGDGSYEIVGVIEVDKVQNDFLSALRSGQKLNRIIAVRESLVRENDKTLLIFYVPEARRQDKPVYLDGDIRRSFIRRGGGDERCSYAEIERFLREASDERYDGQLIDLDPEHCFALDTVRWYRRVFSERNPGYDQSVSDADFLYDWGFVVEKASRRLPTRAGIILFGTTPALLQILPRPVVDYQWINAERADELPEDRWADRLVAEFNLIETWKSLVDRYLRHAEKAFSIQPETLQREDSPPDYIAFREAAINLLMHQDYGDHTRKPVIQFFHDQTVLWNPGDAFASAEELLEPGEKEVRNPRIVAAFRRIGLSEQAGTGVRSIFRNWRQLGRIPPRLKNDKAGKSFELNLLKEELLSENQLLFQAGLGVRLTDPEANVFAFACRQDRLRLIDVKAVTGLSTREAQAVLNTLVVQALVERVEAEPQPHYVIAGHLRTRFAPETPPTNQPTTPQARLVTDQPATGTTNLVTDQPEALRELSETQWGIIAFCEVPRSSAAIMTHLEVTHRTFFRRAHLEPLLQGGILQMTHPERPNHPKQAYVLTEIGAKLKARHLSQKAKAGQPDSNDKDGE